MVTTENDFARNERHITVCNNKEDKMFKKIRDMQWSGCVQILALFFFLGGSLPGYADEHPSEHPAGAEVKKHGLTKEELAKAIKAYVDRDSRLKGGYFLFYDAEPGKPLVLSLKKVHEDRLSRVGEETYFVCADFESGTERPTTSIFS